MRLTKGQAVLAAAVLGLAAGVTPVFFIVMFLTVNRMLGPFFDGWAWTVPVATEITFTLLFLLAVLFEWLRSPSWVLWAAPYLFAALSAVLNVAAGRGSVPAMAGHLAVTLAFFAPVSFAKAGVRRLLVTDADRARAVALADARAHARDVLRSCLGVWWRWRAPVLLRRQLRSGRLPAAVMEAVGTGLASAWEPAVEAWIAAAAALPERAARALAQARAAASAPPAGGTAAATAEVPPAPPPGVPSEASPHPAPVPSRRPSRVVPARASDGELAALLAPLLAQGRDLSPTGVVKAVRGASGGKGSIGHERAGRVLALARAEAGRVVPMGERRHG